MYTEWCTICLCQIEQRQLLEERGLYCIEILGLSFPFIFGLKAYWSFRRFDVPRAPDIWMLTQVNNAGPPWGTGERGSLFFPSAC
jgi:hypothetical protein